MAKTSFPACLMTAIAFALLLTTQIFGQAIPKPGEPCPDFVLPSIADGSKVQLSDYRGKKVLLFHFASW